MLKTLPKIGQLASKMLDTQKVIAYISSSVSKGSSFIDSLVEYSEKNKIDIEVLAEIVKKTDFLKANVREEAENLNLVEKSNRLDIFSD